jgi:hypothetical protein
MDEMRMTGRPPGCAGMRQRMSRSTRAVRPVPTASSWAVSRTRSSVNSAVVPSATSCHLVPRTPESPACVPAPGTPPYPALDDKAPRSIRKQAAPLLGNQACHGRAIHCERQDWRQMITLSEGAERAAVCALAVTGPRASLSCVGRPASIEHLADTLLFGLPRQASEARPASKINCGAITAMPSTTRGRDLRSPTNNPCLHPWFPACGRGGRSTGGRGRRRREAGSPRRFQTEATSMVGGAQ